MAKKTSKTGADIIDYKKIPHLTIRELAFKIRQVDDVLDNPETPESRKDRKPRFAFFLGAGASFQSGIKLAGQMMNDFRRRIFERECFHLETDEEKDDWIKAQDWFCVGEKEYSCLFERYDDDKIARQKYMEAVIKKGEPSFGYLMMAYLLTNNYANTIITTNFDDLAYTSCVTFTGIRPLIYAYGTLASEMRLSSPRPKIFKLHGDYLYSALINTDDEMEKMLEEFNLPDEYPGFAQKVKDISMLDFNMGDDVVRILSEYGLIVIGYEGNDESIRKIFSNIPYNRELFWCYWKPKPPNQEVLQLLKEKNGKLIAIEGFDEMMSEIGSVIKLKEDKLIADIEAQKGKILQLIAKFTPEYTKDFVADVVEKPKEDKQSADELLTDIIYQAINANNNAQYEKAAELYKKALEITEKTIGKEHPDYAIHLNNLASVYYLQGNYEEAVEIYKQAIEIGEKTIGKEHPEYAIRLNNLAGVYRSQGKYDEAIELFKQAFEIDEKTIGKEHPEYAIHLNNLANVYYSQGKYDEAIELFKQAIEIDEKTIGKEHPDYAIHLNNLALIYDSQGKYDEAIELYKQAFEIAEKTIGKAHPSYATRLNNLANVYRSQGKYDEASGFYKQAVWIAKKTIGKKHSDYAQIISNLAKTYNLQNRYDEAIPLHEQALLIDEKTIGKNNHSYAVHLSRLAEAYLNQERYVEALPMFEESLRILEKALPENHKDIKEVRDNLEKCRKALENNDF